MNSTNELRTVQNLISNKGKLLYLTHFGSRLYGTNTATSDTDLKAIYLPNIESVVLGTVEDTIVYTTGDKDSKNSDEDVDITVYSLRYFLQLLVKGEVGAIDLLFSMFRKDTILFEKSTTTDYFRMNYLNLISKESKAFIGYCFNQAAKYGIKGSRYGDLLGFIDYLDQLKK